VRVSNWSGNHAYPATAWHEPTSIDELCEIVAAAPRIRALGSGHCFNDIVDSDALVSLDHLPTVMEIDRRRATVTVTGSVRYGTLATHLHANGWAVHNLASLPHSTVAGAIATATHGSGDRHPNLAAVVKGLDLVTANGDVRHLDASAPGFRGSVVGLGALGVVTAVTLEIEPTYDVAQEVHTGLPWSAALEHFDEITASADSVSLFTDWTGPQVAQVWRKSRVEPVEWRTPDLFGAQPAAGALHPLPGVDPASTTEQLGVAGPWHERLPHFRMGFTPSAGAELQSEYLVAREHAVAALEVVRRLADRIAPLLLVSEIRTIAADNLWLSTAYHRESVGIHFTWQPAPAEVTDLLPTLEDALAPFDARPHWGKLFADADRHVADLYPRISDFRVLAEWLDPYGKFRNDYLERHRLV